MNVGPLVELLDVELDEIPVTQDAPVEAPVEQEEPAYA
jgi:hypothetical protein